MLWFGINSNKSCCWAELPAYLHITERLSNRATDHERTKGEELPNSPVTANVEDNHDDPFKDVVSCH